MEFEINTSVWIDMDILVNMVLNGTQGMTIDEIVNDFIAGLDDCDFYLACIIREEIKKELQKRLDNSN